MRWCSSAHARDVVVVNSCTVTVAADRDTRKAVHRARREQAGTAVILMGCYVDAHPGDHLGADLVIPNRWKTAPAGPDDAVEPPGTHRSRYVLKVQDGCDNRCTFWDRVLADSGQVYSASSLFGGAREGRRRRRLPGDRPHRHRPRVLPGGLAPLVERLLVAAAPARIRLSSIDPSHIDADLCRLLEHPRLCPHLHLPLQSGSDAVLARMGRRYNLKGFEKAVRLHALSARDIALTGDFMVGFPGESEADFQRTLEVTEWAGFMGLHVFRFSARPEDRSRSLPGAAGPVRRATPEAAG